MLYLVTGRALLPRPSSSTKENKVCVSFSRASLIFTICLPLSFNPFSFSLLFFLFLFFVVSFFLPSCFIARWWPPRSTLLWKFCANFFYFFIIILSLLVHKVGRERKLFKDRRKKWSFLFSYHILSHTVLRTSCNVFSRYAEDDERGTRHEIIQSYKSEKGESSTLSFQFPSRTVFLNCVLPRDDTSHWILLHFPPVFDSVALLVSLLPFFFFLLPLARLRRNYLKA